MFSNDFIEKIKFPSVVEIQSEGKRADVEERRLKDILSSECCSFLRTIWDHTFHPQNTQTNKCFPHLADWWLRRATDEGIVVGILCSWEGGQRMGSWELGKRALMHLYLSPSGKFI